MSQREGTDVIQGRRGSSVLDDDDLLWEILLHLSPQPSSLPRASAVCKRWRRLVNDPRFLRQFHTHHRRPPLLGVFRSREKIVFTPVLDPPNRIPSVRFNLGRFSADSSVDGLLRLPNENHLLGCRHGRILIADYLREEVIVCDPITGEQFPLAVPLKFWRGNFNGAVLCAADDQGHVHGACLSSPFKVVLVSVFRSNSRPLACVYSSESGAWGNVISIDVPCQISHAAMPASLVGGALYWLCLPRDLILEFDLKKQSIAMIRGPLVTKEFSSCQIIPAEDGAIGFAALSYPRFQIWQRNSNGQDVPTWVLSKNIEMHNILELPPQIDGGSKEILGYSEDTDEIFILVQPNVYMVQIKSMQSKKLHETNYISNYHPFTSFYPSGIPISRKCGGTKVLHDALESLPGLISYCATMVE